MLELAPRKTTTVPKAEAESFDCGLSLPNVPRTSDREMEGLLARCARNVGRLLGFVAVNALCSGDVEAADNLTLQSSFLGNGAFGLKVDVKQVPCVGTTRLWEFDYNVSGVTVRSNEVPAGWGVTGPDAGGWLTFTSANPVTNGTQSFVVYTDGNGWAVGANAAWLFVEHRYGTNVNEVGYQPLRCVVPATGQSGPTTNLEDKVQFICDGVITTAAINDQGFAMQFKATAEYSRGLVNLRGQVEKANEMGAEPVWIDIGASFAVPPGTNTFSLTDPTASGPQGYYRFRLYRQ